MKKCFMVIGIVCVLGLLNKVAEGQNTFEKTFGDTGNCYGVNIIQTYDSGFLITSSKNEFYPVNNLYIIKTNFNGDTMWTKKYPLDSGVVWKGIQTYDSGYIFTGSKSKNLLIFKVNYKGDSLWEKTYYFTSYSYIGRSIFEASDHTLYIAGENFIGTYFCCYPLVMHTDSSGNLLNQISLPVYGGRAYDIIETPDNNLVISNSEILGPPIPKLTKISKTGSIIWDKTYDTHCECYVTLTKDKGYLISGSNVSNNYKPYLIKTDTAGSVLWNKSFTNYNILYSSKIAQSADNGCLLVGGTKATMGDLCLFKVSSIGDSVWKRTFGGTGDDFGKSVISTSDNGFAVVGYTTSFGNGKKEIYFIKTDSLGLITSYKTFFLEKNQLTVYPNPVFDKLTIESSYKSQIQILNLSGQIIKTITAAGSVATIDVSGFARGMYFIKATNEKGVSVSKFIKE